MRDKFYRTLLKMNSWALVGVAIVLSVALTTSLNSIFARITGSGIKPLTILFATIDAILIPAIVAPIILNILKRAARLQERNQQLQTEVDERQRAEQAAQHRASHLQMISDLAVECAAASPDTDVIRLIAERLRTLTNALAVGISTYDAQQQAFTVQHVLVPEQTVLSALNNFLGSNIVGMVYPTSAKTLQQILDETVLISDDLHEISFGVIPRPIAAMIRKTFGIGRFTVLALCHGGKLWGTSAIASRADQPAIEHDLAITFANVAAVAIRRQRAEQALRQREEQLRAIVTHAPLIFFVLDADGIFVVSEGRGLARLGLKPGQVVGQSAFEFYRGWPQIVRVLEQAMAGEITHAIHNMGETIFEVYYTLLRGGTEQQPDRIDGVIGVAIDVTERQQIETEREELIQELEAKNDELERFTYTVSHDLKSPLITIAGFLGYVEQDAASGDADRLKRDIDLIRNATNKMQQLLDELLELTRIGRLVNPSQHVSMSELAHEAAEIVAGQLTIRGVHIEIAPDMPIIIGDRARLVEVVQNLVDNACKFMGDQPQPRVEIGVRKEEGKPVFFVRDNGIGIEPRYHDRVFDLFVKLNPDSEGTGIGLALVKRIVQVHGGKIWIESEGLGYGSTFCFTLPAGFVQDSST